MSFMNCIACLPATSLSEPLFTLSVPKLFSQSVSPTQYGGGGAGLIESQVKLELGLG